MAVSRAPLGFGPPASRSRYRRAVWTFAERRSMRQAIIVSELSVLEPRFVTFSAQIDF
jgi:hypothetical protein